jgi:hypothetical protein
VLLPLLRQQPEGVDSRHRAAVSVPFQSLPGWPHVFVCCSVHLVPVAVLLFVTVAAPGNPLFGFPALRQLLPCFLCSSFVAGWRGLVLLAQLLDWPVVYSSFFLVGFVPALSALYTLGCILCFFLNEE